MVEFNKGSNREELLLQTEAQQKEIARQRATGGLVVDERRVRPRYFDGRFLAARDLTREQDYFLARQADLGMVGGVGVVHGLDVARGSAFNTVAISKGHGVTDTGEMVMLIEDRELHFSQLVQTDTLSEKLGQLRHPHEPTRTLTGLFVLVLRPLEYTAHKVASYPTSIDGKRRIEDGDIVEASMVTLIPYPNPGPETDPDSVRKRVARTLFLAEGKTGLPTGALPLAMMQLNRGHILWLDPFMVRREIGMEQSATLGLGFASRALREAHLLQYNQQLQEVRTVRAASHLAARFAAHDYFALLPPAGPMPGAAIDPTAFTQFWFPPEIETDISIVPEDEINALLDDSFALPPIDLTLDSDALEATSVLVMVSVPRSELRRVQTSLSRLIRPLRVAAPNLISRRKPLEILAGLRLPPTISLPILPIGGEPAPADAAWSNLISNSATLWYTRRRNLAYRSDVVGLPPS